MKVFQCSHLLITILAIIGCYFIGNFSTSYLLAKKKLGVDIRTVGSGNAGSTNVLRTLGKKYGALVFLADMLKGGGASAIGLTLGGVNLGVFCAISCVVGHVFPILLSFRGGKGVATSLGAFAFLFPVPTGVALMGGVLTITLSKYVSLGSMVGLCLFAPIAFFFGYRGIPLYAGILMSIFILYTHRENISRLYQGAERKLELKKH